MQQVEAKSILSAKNNMNIYRGCTHGCIYCDSRSECYGMTYTFENIQVKSNAPQLLEAALGKKRQRCMITTGAMTDPYLPLEAKLGQMRRCLEIIEQYGFGVSVLTKSDLVVRDIDLFQKIQQKAKCVVQMTLTTYDEALCKTLEPNVATTHSRFLALKQLQAAGIPTVVWLTPILPLINDSEENIAGILDYCVQAGVKGVLTFGMGMTLRYGNREYYYQKLDEHFPGLKQQYMRQFGSAYGLKSPQAKQLDKLARTICKQHNILYGTAPVFDYVTRFEPAQQQLSLFDV